jgi:hypothetical protein
MSVVAAGLGLGVDALARSAGVFLADRFTKPQRARCALRHPTRRVTMKNEGPRLLNNYFISVFGEFRPQSRPEYLPKHPHRAGAELTGLSAFVRRNQPAAQLGSSMFWIAYRRRRSPPIACRASFSMSRTFPWAPAPDASRMSPCPRTINNTT